MNRFLRLLGLCRRAGRLSLGYNKAEESVKKKKAKIIFVASDVSLKTEKELKFITRQTDIEVVRTDFDIETFSSALDLRAGVAAIEDEGFMEAMKKELQETQSNEEI